MATPEVEELRAAASLALPDYLRDLERLVNVDCGSYTKVGVDEVGTWTARRLEDLGASVERHANADVGDTIVGTFERDAVGPSVLMLAHLDTVFEAGTVAQRPFAMHEGRALGPGVSDMKAGLLTGLYAFAALRAIVTGPSAEHGAVADGDWLPVRRLVFIANPDEEIGSPASEPIIRAHARDSDAALVLESARANGDIVSSRKGHTEFRLDIRGRAAHAGVEPEKGRSAILEAAHKVIALSELDKRFTGLTVNSGVIRGGTRPNIVPDSASIEVDVRAVERRQLQSAEAAVAAIAGRSAVADVSTAVELVYRFWPMERSSASGRLVGMAVEAAAELGFELGEAATGGASDGNTTSSLGVPTIDGLGPIGGMDHGPDEYIELDSIVPRTALLARILQAIGRDAVMHHKVPGIAHT